MTRFDQSRSPHPFVSSDVETPRAPREPNRAGWRIGALTLVLAACSSPDQPANTTALAQVDATRQVEDGRIVCARGGAPLQRDCTVEQAQSAGGLVLTLRHPDGGFRRLSVTQDGRGVIAADGAEPARVAVIGPGVIEVTVAGDRYRLPATVQR